MNPIPKRAPMTLAERLADEMSLPVGVIPTLTGPQLMDRIALVDDKVKELKALAPLPAHRRLRLECLEIELLELRWTARPKLVWRRP